MQPEDPFLRWLSMNLAAVHTLLRTVFAANCDSNKDTESLIIDAINHARGLPEGDPTARLRTGVRHAWSQRHERRQATTDGPSFIPASPGCSAQDASP